MHDHQPIVEISWHGVDKRSAVDALVRSQVDRLADRADNLMSCRVAIEHPHHAADGGEWRVRLDLTMAPRADFAVVESGAEERRALPEVVRSAFSTAERRVKQIRAQQQDRRPSSGLPVTGIVREVHADGGLIEDLDGRRIHFGPGALVEASLADVRAGVGVWFEAVDGDGGAPRATTVRVVDGRGSGVFKHDDARADGVSSTPLEDAAAHWSAEA